MKPIANFDRIQPAGSIENLPAGGYIVRIRQAAEKRNRNNGGAHLELLFDIDQGEYQGFFARDYRSQSREDKFWRGIFRQNVPQEDSEKYGLQCGFFKRFTNAVEDSNPGYHWDWDEGGLRDKLCGVVFGEREKRSQRGTVYTVTEAVELVSLQDIAEGKYTVPPRKPLDGRAAPSGFAACGGDLPF